jgi:hypothetical protein
MPQKCEKTKSRVLAGFSSSNWSLWSMMYCAGSKETPKKTPMVHAMRIPTRRAVAGLSDARKPDLPPPPDGASPGSRACTDVKG